MLLGPAAFAADPVHYKTVFAPSGDAALDALLPQTSALVALGKKLPPAPFALIGRGQADAQQFLIVLHSFGYDAGTVSITINGLAITDPSLADQLTQAPARDVAVVRVALTKGALFHVSTVALPGLPVGFSAPPLVKSGDPALAAPILDVSARLRTALHNAGYAFAQVSAPLAVATTATNSLALTYTVTPGPRVRIGAITFSGLTRTDAAFLRRHLALHPGQPYSDTTLADARNALLGLGVFSAVTPVPQNQVGQGGEIPILFRVTEQKRHAVTLGGAYATDTGVTLSAAWEDRNLFGHAETLTITATANGLGGTGTTAPGYDLKALFTKPDYYARGQTLSLSLEALKQSLTAYSRTGILAGAALSRPLSPQMSLTYGPAVVTERVVQQGIGRTYLLLQFPATLAYSTADSVLEPTRGVTASFTLTPTEPVQGTNRPFLIAYGTAAAYLPVEPAAAGVLALRGQVGSIQGTSQFAVPPDQRFYAGGSGTVRGYTYQTIGPLFPDDTPEGGLAMDAFSLEFRQHVAGNFGIVPFIDAGQVSTANTPFTGTLRVGAGLGVRYYTGIGPIRVDLAFPLTRTAGSSAFGIYVGLGEAF